MEDLETDQESVDLDKSEHDYPSRKPPTFLKNYPFTETTEALHDLIRYIYTHWKATRSPPDPDIVIKRTSRVIRHLETGNRYAKERKRKFENVETCGFFSVPWEPYAELGVTELDTCKMVLENLVPNFKLETPSRDGGTRKEGGTRKKKTVIMPSILYSFGEKDKIDNMTGYDLIKKSVAFVKQIYEDMKYPERNFQSIYYHRKKEIEDRNKTKKMEMVFIPFKAVEDVVAPGKAQNILDSLVKKLSLKLSAILDILHTLLNFDDDDVNCRLPLSRLAMIRLKYTKDVAVNKVPHTYGLVKQNFLSDFDQQEILNAKLILGHPPPIWQNKFKVTGIPQFENGKVCIAPNVLVNQLKGLLLRSLEKIRRGGVYLLEKLEGEFERRFKYTCLALSALPLTLIQQRHLCEYSDYLKALSDKAAFARNGERITEEDKELAHYLLHDINEVLHEMLNQAVAENRIIAEDRPKAMWFQMLENEAKDIGILKTPEIEKYLSELYKFHNINLRKIPNVQEKFCLAVGSVPLEEACTKHWQEAAKFIHERMLEANEGMIEYWLDERGLPKFL